MPHHKLIAGEQPSTYLVTDPVNEDYRQPTKQLS